MKEIKKPSVCASRPHRQGHHQSQAGLVEKFVDALVWVFWPVYLHQHGVDLSGMGGIVGMYGFTWGSAQFLTGKLSDRVGRQPLNVWGMWICGADIAHPQWRTSAIGIYRFWPIWAMAWAPCCTPKTIENAQS